MRFKIQWPDESIDSCYSPSLVIKEHLSVGTSYAMSDFLERCRVALNIASERVRAKYGFACSSAIDQLRQIEESATRFSQDKDSQVLVVSFDR